MFERDYKSFYDLSVVMVKTGLNPFQIFFSIVGRNLLYELYTLYNIHLHIHTFRNIKY